VKKLNSLLCALVLSVVAINIYGQDSTQALIDYSDKRHKAAMTQPDWIIGIHGAVSDDDGEAFTNLFNVSDSWNFMPYPTRVTVEKKLNNAWRVEAAVTYMQYKAGKVINDNPIRGTQTFFAGDINAKYDLNDLIGETSVFDPYTVTGLGFTHRSAIPTKNTPTVNLGLGFNVWIYKNFGICLQSTAKFKIISSSSNYLLHSAGIVYRIGAKSNDGDFSKGSIREQR
jgi:OOP family OmpA-OmpF porin